MQLQEHKPHSFLSAPTEPHTNPIGSGDIVCMYVYSALLWALLILD